MHGCTVIMVLVEQMKLKKNSSLMVECVFWEFSEERYMKISVIIIIIIALKITF